MASTRPSWSGFAAWELVGVLVGLTLVAIFSIGIFVLPLLILAIVIAARRWPEPGNLLGIVAGVGVLVLGIALLHIGSQRSCATSGTGTGGSCDEFDIRPWLAVGAALVVAGHVAFARLLRVGRPA